MLENPLQGLVQIGIVPGAVAHIGEKFAGKDVEAFFPDRFGAAELRIGIGQASIVKGRVACAPLLFVEIAGQVFRDEPVEQHAEHVALEIPPIDAAPQVIGDAPDGLVQLGTFNFPGVAHHRKSLCDSVNAPFMPT